ncbi:MAG: helix-turn-helix transcriptional regulator [bacterium]
METNDILKALIDVIRHEREGQGFNYEDFSAVSGLHRTTIGLYDRGERGPTVEAALNMAHALGIPLSELLRRAEDTASQNSVCESFTNRREAPLGNFRNADRLRSITGLSIETVRSSMLDCYQTLDTIDAQLLAHSSEPIASLVELANLSSIIGNLIGAGLAVASNGLYVRNRPHSYPDLVPQTTSFGDLEIKVALEKNKPKGHLPKAGNYLTFRYVLCNDLALYEKGKECRGKRVFIWEVKVGTLSEGDFDMSNTEGDPGKTAVIKTCVFNAMPLIYFDSDLLPYSTKSLCYPGFN